MCECGCVSNWKRYKIPGPGKSFYMVILTTACSLCDGPSGVSIEHILPGTFEHGYYKDPVNYDGDLPFEKWSHCLGCAIVTGFRKHEFIAACQNHLIGVSSKELGTKGRIDEAGAEVILEEMYGDTCFAPRLVEANNG